MRYLIPLASSDDLFPREEFHFPKPLVEVDGQPMIERVIDVIRDADPVAEFIFIVRREDCRDFSLDRSLIEASRGRCRVIQIGAPTAGAACSALLAVDYIDDEHPLVVCNGDQVIEADLAAVLSGFRASDADAGVITFPSVHPRWSYVRLDEHERIVESAEKRVISRHAIAGFYYFRTGASFVEAAKRSILNGRSTNGRFYIAPSLNELILQGLTVRRHVIRAEDYQSLFSPQRVENYERTLQSRRLRAENAHSAERGQALTVVIPMAGLGSRFASAGYDKPKPFIDVAGMTMIERVMENLKVDGARFVLIARRAHLEQEPETVKALLDRGDVVFAPIDLVTEGAACTVLTARGLWNPEGPLLIANCDQIVDFDCRAFIEDACKRRLDGSILTFRDRARDPKWSFARLSDDGHVVEVQEKKPISDIATVGLYYFSRAQNFLEAAADMISRNERVNNEFYVCPVYNYAIATGAKVGIYEVAQEAMHGIGTPEDLDAYLELLEGA